ncbi:Bug family tripartite tricarboxylate transporter substrate binding protein [Pigmentiphaga litoralis]|uniref:Bug family tripartite tricarboxylate transporter substrate binding protein n=1 Tax=Pigmentiphaga litoralis TaxID=516702 RepID=UPI003B438D22
MHRIVCTLAAALSLLVTAQAHATYPDHPIKIVVPFPPGGGTDAVARVLAQKLGDKLGQTVIVENRPGAATVIGAQAVARAAPDGYTLMISGSSTYSVLPALKKTCLTSRSPASSRSASLRWLRRCWLASPTWPPRHWRIWLRWPRRGAARAA